MSDDTDRTASLMTPAKLAQLKVGPRPAASPAAWLDQLATDAGSGHVRRLVDLRQQLEAQVRERDWGPVGSASQALHDAVHDLDFADVQPRGWLARATGKGRGAAGGFVSQVERIGRAAEDLADEVRALQKLQQSHVATERTLLECEVEVRAIEKIMDQGARWLQDMRNQLKVREAQGGDAAAQNRIREDTARCELLFARLKQLRAATTAAQQMVERSKGAAGRRASVLDALQRVLDGEWKAWQEKLAPVADQAVASGSAADGVARAQKAQRKLQAALEEAARAAGTLQSQERAVADELAALRAPLQAAA